MEPVKLTPDFSISNIVLGFWRVSQWNLTNDELKSYIHYALDLGISTFDHADIYGNYTADAIFGSAFKPDKLLRSKIQLVTKCGIKLKSDKFPERKIGTYDTGYNHVIESVNQSLKNLQTYYIDLLLIHRPDPLMNASETARAIIDLKQSGKVRYFGVSNFLPSDFDLLQQYVPFPLITNQIEVSVMHQEHFLNGNINYLQQHKIKPMVWSPLAGGQIFNPKTNQAHEVQNTLKQIAEELQIPEIDTIAYAWLLKHPVTFIPVAGTGKKERLKAAVDALKLPLTNEQWYRIYNAAMGKPLP